MKDAKMILVIDCGATNVAVSCIDKRGVFIRSASFRNAAVKQPGKNGDMLVWDLDAIWEKACRALREVCRHVKTENIIGVTVTTFGADGTFVDENGRPAYPVISWQCVRTEGMMGELEKRVGRKDVYGITGYKPMHFNTLYRWMWLRKNAPAVFKGRRWLMMPGLISHRLTGKFSVDLTSASTTMALDMKSKTWSKKMLSYAGMDASAFPGWVEPGDSIGEVTKKASVETGVPEGTPVIASGHDTQFALIGSGAKPNEVVLSSGTWEILLMRADRFKPSDYTYENGLIFESDADRGLWNPQLLMMGSGVLEWVRRHLYSSCSNKSNVYDIMISEAEKVKPGTGDCVFLPNFVMGTGPMQKYGVPGMISGLSLGSNRGEIYRSALEGLSFQLKRAIEVMKTSTGFSPAGIRVAGGGAKNRLWNRIRADVTGLPVIITAQKEITALGAALNGFVKRGVYGSMKEALENVEFKEEVTYPSRHTKDYLKPYEKFLELHEKYAKKQEQEKNL